MPTKRFYIMMTLARCGETTWQHDGRLHGSTDLPLSDSGRATVQADLMRLAGVRLATVYHAADEAATATAKLLAGATSARTKTVDDLSDPSLGLFEGLREQDLAERYPKRHKQWQEDPLLLIPPEGEPIVDARARVFRAVSKLLRRSRAEEVGVVLHRMAYGFMRCWLADCPHAEQWPTYADERRVERYAVSTDAIDLMREIARAEVAEAGS